MCVGFTNTPVCACVWVFVCWVGGIYHAHVHGHAVGSHLSEHIGTKQMKGCSDKWISETTDCKVDYCTAKYL